MKEEKKNKYNCAQYRNEMILLALKIRLNNTDLSEKEKNDILNSIREIESTICMD